jgi:predicted  nucleic acid-binding Zn-ribbon protein
VTALKTKRERNRQASRKYRQGFIEREAGLEKEIEQLKVERATKDTQIVVLQTQVAHLQGELNALTAIRKLRSK